MQRKIFFAIRVATFIDFVYKTYLAPLSLWRIRSKLNPSKDPKYYVRVYLKVFLLLSISLIMIKVSESSLICWKKRNFHSVKSVQIQSYFWSVFSCVWTEYKNIRTRRNSIFGHFSCSILLEKLPLTKVTHATSHVQYPVKFRNFCKIFVLNVWENCWKDRRKHYTEVWRGIGRVIKKLFLERQSWTKYFEQT